LIDERISDAIFGDVTDDVMYTSRPLYGGIRLLLRMCYANRHNKFQTDIYRSLRSHNARSA